MGNPVLYHVQTGYFFYVMQGIYARFLMGNASAPDAAVFADVVEPLARQALKIARRLLVHSSSKYIFSDHVY